MTATGLPSRVTTTGPDSLDFNTAPKRVLISATDAVFIIPLPPRRRKSDHASSRDCQHVNHSAFFVNVVKHAKAVARAEAEFPLCREWRGLPERLAVFRRDVRLQPQLFLQRVVNEAVVLVLHKGQVPWEVAGEGQAVGLSLRHDGSDFGRSNGAPSSSPVGHAVIAPPILPLCHR